MCSVEIITTRIYTNAGKLSAQQDTIEFFEILYPVPKSLFQLRKSYLRVHSFRYSKYMSSQDYFHERAEESRHNEMTGYIMFLAGSMFFIGGILSALSMSGSPNWLLFIPYSADPPQALYLELTFLTIGLVLIIAGAITGLHFYRDRAMYMQELLKVKTPDSLLRTSRARNAPVKRNSKP
jgi:hypothetical protein